MEMRRLLIPFALMMSAVLLLQIHQGSAGAAAKTKPEQTFPPNWDTALPANDSKDPCNSSRFNCVLGGEAVQDNETGLVWERSPSVQQLHLLQAFATCFDKTVGGRKGWRLPTAAELSSLVDPSIAPSITAPRLPEGHPFTNIFGAGFFYWTASAGQGTWAVEFENGNVLRVEDIIDPSLIVEKAWCVRGGQGAGSQ
jgi:hypothetical protein